MADQVATIRLEQASEHGFDTDRLVAAFGLITSWAADGVIPGAAAIVARRGTVVGEGYIGWADAGTFASADTIWHLASITKPFTATAVMGLVERGMLDLDEPIGAYVPEFLSWTPGPWRDRITLRHVLAHCSGLPGYSRNNVELRQAHEPLSAFVRPYGSEPLVFEPGTLHYYSNCGILMAAEVIARAVAGGLRQTLPEPAIASYHGWVKHAVLDPLGLRDTTFFPDHGCSNRVARVHDVWNQASDWEMSNSAFYRSLGIPWGGLYCTARDLVAFVDTFLPAAGGKARLASGSRLLSSGSAAAMTSVQFAPPDAPATLAPALRDGPAPDPARPAVDWGIGWMLKGRQTPHRFGSLTSPSTFGHLGASGTMAWADPTLELVVVLLTNRTLASGWSTDVPRMGLFSNAVIGALV